MQSHLERWTINFQEILLQNLHESTFEGGRDHREDENFKFLRLVMVIKTRKVPSINHVNIFFGFLTPPSTSWTLLQNKDYVVKWSFGKPPPPQLSTLFMNDPKYASGMYTCSTLKCLRTTYINDI